MRTILKYIIIFVALFASLAVTTFVALGSCRAELLPKALAAETADTVEQVKSESSDVFAEIQRNVDMVAELKDRVQQAQMEGGDISLDAIVDDIETVTQSYESLAGRRDDIRAGLLDKVAKVNAVQKAIDAEVETLEQKRHNYSEQLALVSDPDPEIEQTRKEALTRAIGYIDQQIQLWTDFGKIEEDIAIELSGVQQRIDSFLSMIESTALVFREGLNLLKLQQDINEAVELFSSDIPTMERLSQDMRDSWDNLDYLLESLTGIANIGIQ